MTDSKLIKLTGLWLNESRDGQKYMSGTLGGVRVLVFRNKNKTKDSHPDYELFFAPVEQSDRPQDSGDDIPL